MSDQLNEFISDQHATNLHLTECLARIEQSQKDTNVRLFGGDGQKGTLPYMIEKAEETAKTIDGRIKVLENWRGTSRAWIAGAVAILGLEGSALGLYISRISSHIQMIQKITK